MTLSILRAPEVEAVKEPKREAWKNRWLCVSPIVSVCVVCGVRPYYEPGDEFISHCATFPSADAARAQLDSLRVANGQKYLGPIRVEAAP